MSNDYFDASSYSTLTRLTLARADAVNTILATIVAGFDKFPSKLSLREDRVTYSADTGAANAYVVTLAFAPPAYVTGLCVRFVATAANTGASTLNVNSLGVKTIKNGDLSDLAANSITAGAAVMVIYDGTYFQLVSPLSAAATAAMTSAISSAATATTQASASSASASASATSATAAAASATAAATSATAAAASAASAQRVYLGTVAGSGDVMTSPFALAAWATGIEIEFIAVGTNTTGPTLNVHSLGAVNVVDMAGNALPAGALVSGRRYRGTYTASGNIRVGDTDVSSAVALAATDNIGRMTALRTAALIAQNAPAEVAASAGTAGVVALASQAEALAGVENTKAMTSLRTLQSIQTNVPAASTGAAGIQANATQAQAATGTSTTLTVTPNALIAAVQAMRRAM